MQGADAGAGRGAGGADNRLEGREDLGGAGAAAAAAGEALRVPVPLHAPGPGGDAFSTIGRPETRIHEFVVYVPFPSPLEAEIARESLAPDREPHGSVVKELTVTDNVLAIRWRAENPRLLRISVNNFLDQLSLVMRTMQRFGPPVYR